MWLLDVTTSKILRVLVLIKPNILSKKANFIRELQKQKSTPHNYEEAFLKARNVFKHQLVFHPGTNKVKPLQEWEDSEDTQGRSLCGHYPFNGVQTVNSIMGF